MSEDNDNVVPFSAPPVRKKPAAPVDQNSALEQMAVMLQHLAASREREVEVLVQNANDLARMSAAVQLITPLLKGLMDTLQDVLARLPPDTQRLQTKETHHDR